MVQYPEPQLYDLAADIGERHNLQGRKEHAPLIEELSKLCREYQEDLKTHSRPAGRAP